MRLKFEVLSATVRSVGRVNVEEQGYQPNFRSADSQRKPHCIEWIPEYWYAPVLGVIAKYGYVTVLSTDWSSSWLYRMGLSII
jgi:hypothetical protein